MAPSQPDTRAEPSNIATITAVQRARTRIDLHGWRVGPANPGQRRVQTFGGWCLEDAVLGKGRRRVEGNSPAGTPGEEAALALIEGAIGTLFGAELLALKANDPIPHSVIAAWNDAPGRTKADVIDVLTRAEQVASA